MPLAASARITGRYSGLAPAITALTATFSTVSSQYSRKAGRPQLADHLVGRMAGALEHRRNPLLGRQDDGEEVGPVVVDEQLLQVVFGIGCEQPWRRPLEGEALQVFVIKRPRQPLDDLLHERPLGNRIDAFDIAAQLLGREIDHRLRNVGLPRARHAGGTRG